MSVQGFCRRNDKIKSDIDLQIVDGIFIGKGIGSSTLSGIAHALAAIIILLFGGCSLIEIEAKSANEVISNGLTFFQY